MGVDYQLVLKKIRQRAPGMKARELAADENRSLAVGLLDIFPIDPEEIARKIEIARSYEKNLRCAQLMDESIDYRLRIPDTDQEGTIIAVDGSQILPDKHQPEMFGLINIGGVILRVGSGEAPDTDVDSILLLDEDLYPDGYLIAESTIELTRDLEERKFLLRHASNEFSKAKNVIALVDGPIELWGRRDSDARSEFQRFLGEYLEALKTMASTSVTYAGYVDKPSADHVTRMLEIIALDDSRLEGIRDYHPLRGVTDQWLFTKTEKLALPPGCRSAIFGLRSRSDDDFTDELGLCFFYLNVSADEKYPSIARVEIPKWVAQDAEKINALQTALIDQCRVMGAKPYPYVLHRAHETAMVSNDEKKQLVNLLQNELINTGLEIGEISSKQSAKDHEGRKSFGTGRGKR